MTKNSETPVPIIAEITGQCLGFEDIPFEIKEERKASRLFLINDKNEIAVVFTGYHGHHKLPGGGIEEGEEPETAAVREAYEEAGCRVELTSGIIAAITEFREKFFQKQISFLYLAKVIGTPEDAKLTPEELSQNYEKAIWVSPQEALKLFEQDKPKTYLGKFMHARDSLFLKYALKYIRNL